jgi:CheY-like chemotaxis protein
MDSVNSRTAAPIIAVPISLARPKALLVDDNIINLRIMQMYCTKRGLPYSCATDGQQAVEIFSEHQSLAAAGKGAAFQLILMDLQMPVCDGIEATRQIRLLEKRAKCKASVLFIVTGQDSLTDRESADSVGADEYFVKPVGIKLLDRGLKRYFPTFGAN